MSNVLLACPTYDGQIHMGAAMAFWLQSSRNHQVSCCPQGNSLLAHNFNDLWCTALNLQKERKLKWFAMLHADLQPEPFFLDKLIHEAEVFNADMLSAVVPIKDNRGLTSTSIAKPGDKFTQFCRLTQAQVNHHDFPQTFGIEEAADALERLPDPLRITDVPREALLVNTGCFVCRIDKPWSSKVWFEIADRIVVKDGLWSSEVEPEDWNFSRKLIAHGAKVMATKCLKMIHWGVSTYCSDVVWGSTTDKINR